jgi:hypothetical protein
MTRRRQESRKRAWSYPPIPDELLELVDDQGHYRFHGFVESPAGQVVRDPRWDLYKKLRREWCAEAGVTLTAFRAAVIDRGSA